MDRTEMLASLALTLLADAVISEIEGGLQDEMPHRDEATGRKLFDMVVRPQQDVCATLEETADDLGLDLSKYLPIQLIEKIEADVNKRWAGKLTLEKLYEESEQAAHRLVLNALGHGVSADDETEDALFFDRMDIPDGERRPVAYFEGPYDEASQFVDAAIEKL
jgi:hypothetical protein